MRSELHWTLRACRRAAAIIAAAATWLALPAAADVLVVSSTTADLRPGMQLPDGTELKVPQGARVRVMLPSGATLTINGPTSRPVKEISKGEPIVEVVWAKAKEMFATGGVDQARPGATRSFAPARPPETPFSWSLVGGTATGNVCIIAGAPVEIERPAGLGAGAGEAFVRDTAADLHVAVAFPAGAARVAWPAALRPTDGKVYTITVGNLPPRTVRMRTVEKARTTEELTLKTLVENDCRQQARAWFRS